MRKHEVVRQSNNPSQERLLTFSASDDHGEDAGRIFLPVLLALWRSCRYAEPSWIKSASVVLSRMLGGGIANVEKYLVESAVGKIAVDQFAQLFGVAERARAGRQSGG